MIDLKMLNKAIGLEQARKRLRGRGGRAPSLETVRRWANPKRGASTPNGRVVLQSIKLGGDIVTTVEWCEQFELERARMSQRAQPPRDTPKRTARANQRQAEKILASIGAYSEVS